jgi:hypothetical protein
MWSLSLKSQEKQDFPGCGASPWDPCCYEAEVGGLRSEARLGKSMRPYLKNTLKPKRVRGCSLRGRALALSSNPSTSTTTKKFRAQLAMGT